MTGGGDSDEPSGAAEGTAAGPVPALALTRSQMHDELDMLLESGDPERFWNFAARLAHGCRIGALMGREAREDAQREGYGFEAGQTEEEAAKAARAFNIWCLINLLRDDRGARFLPAKFAAGAIQNDLLTMLGGPRGDGAGRPQVLYCKGESVEKTIGRGARRKLVLAVCYEAGHQSSTLDAAVAAVLRHPDTGKGLNLETFDGWKKDVPKLARNRAYEAGTQGGDADRYRMTREEIAAALRAVWIRRTPRK